MIQGKRIHFLLFFALVTLFIQPEASNVELVSAKPLIQQGTNTECKFTYITTTFGDNQISSNGRYVVFQKITPFPGSLYSLQVFVYDKINRTTEQASLSWDGKSMLNNDDYSSYPTISGNGDYVVFFSGAEGLVQDPNAQGYQLYQRDRVEKTTSLATVGIDGPGRGDPKDPHLSGDGRYLVFDSLAENLVVNDTNGTVDAFIRDNQLGITEMVSIASDGSQGFDYADHGHLSSVVSSDGRFVVFTYALLKDDDGETRSGLFLRDRLLKKTFWIGPGNGPAITPNGDFIAFSSYHAFVPKDNNNAEDIYLYHRKTGVFELISLKYNGTVGQGATNYFRPAISADGNEIAFTSEASDLVPNDVNGFADVFLRDRTKNSTIRLTVDENGLEANGATFNVSMSNDGRTLSITTMADNLYSQTPPSQSEPHLLLCEREPLAIELKNYIPFIRR